MTDRAPAPILLEGVTYRVAETALVADLTIEVEAAQTLVLLGRSGSGKTTALRLINGLLRPTDGRVLVEGSSTEEWDPIRLRRKIGYVIQEVGLFPHFTVSENVDAEKVSATFEHGMLELRLPVAETAKPRRIEIGGVKASPKAA